MVHGLEFIAEVLTSLLGHGVIAAREDIHSGIPGFRPGVDGDVRFRQKSQSSYALWFESMGDEVEKSGTSTLRSGRDGGSQKSFVVELGFVAIVKLENAVLAHHVDVTGNRGTGRGAGLSVVPSRVGMQA